MDENKKESNQNLLLQYGGYAMQLLVSLGIATFAGIKFDAWLNFHFPVFVWLLPLIVLILLMVKVIKDTSKK